MNDTTKLDAGQKHLLKLVVHGRNEDGWAPVSATVLPFVEMLPKALIDLEPTEGGRGRVRLTAEGEAVVKYL